MNTLATGLSFSWQSIGSALANHLWQSTLFAAVAAVLTLLLRQNQARVRYWLWLAASLKFLLPFSLLVVLGTQLRWSEAPASHHANISTVIEEIGQPFGSASLPPPAPPQSSAYALAARCLPYGLAIIWFACFVALLLVWLLRWRRVTATMRGAMPIETGREIDTLRRLEPMSGIGRPTRLIVTESTAEPGIIGIFRPVMFLPTGIPERLTDSELAAVIAHELCHIRRRDNLMAAVHMLVEALFWFHPIVFWIGARLIDERERACDEEVLTSGSDPRIYAKGILKVCEFYLEAPLACVAGVTGSNLKKRIEAIMIQRIAQKLAMGKKLLLAMVAAAAIFGPVALGILHPASSQAQSQARSSTATPIQIESATIKASDVGTDQAAGKPGKPVVSSRMVFTPESFKAENVTLQQLIRAAFGVQNSQISSAPDWGNTSLYNAEVKFTTALATDHPQRVTQQRFALQGLLADRFKLQVHRELKSLPVYELAVGTNGSKLTEAQANSDALQKPSLMQQPPGHFTGKAIDIATLIAVLGNQLGTPIVDKTGLKGNYDFTLVVDWPKTRSLPDDPASLLKAVSEQLGLELKPANDLVEVLVIDHAEPVTSHQRETAAR